MEENKRKTIILTFIGALTLLFVVVGGTFAYFQIVNTGEGETTSSLTGETEDLTKYGTPTLTQGTSNLHINLKASDMGYSKKGTEYWATNVEEKDYENGKQQHIISTAGISGAESEDTELTCTSELTIKASGSILEDTNPLVEEDGYVYLGSKNGGSNKVSINPTQIDLKQIIDKSMGKGVGYQTEINYTIKGNTSIDITIDIDIINRDANQNSLAGKSINFTITNKNISCSVKENEEKAYANFGGQKDYYKSEDYRYSISSITFVDNIPSDDELTTKVANWDLSDTASGTPEKSVMGWLENSSNDDGNYDLYIGSKSTIYAKDLSNTFYDMPMVKSINNLKKLNTSEATSMASMFYEYFSLTTLDVSSFDTSNVTNMSNMFRGKAGGGGQLTKIIGLDTFVTTNVENMSYMFANNVNLTSLDLSSFNTSNVINMSYMFGSENESRTLNSVLTFKDWPNFITTKVENMSYMFFNYGGTTLDLSSFDTSQVTDMSSMFSGCRQLETLDLSSFTFDKITGNGKNDAGSQNTFSNVRSTCQVKVKSSQKEIFESKFPYDERSRAFTPSYVD